MKKIELKKITPIFYLAPFLVVFLLFLVYPILYSFRLSFYKITVFTDWYNILGDMKFCGFANYQKLLFNDWEFWWSLVVTFIYALLSIPTSIILSLLIAILLIDKLRARGLFRSSYFLPNVLDLFVVGTIWVFIYSPTYGLIDSILNSFGLGKISESGLLGNPLTALPSVAVAVVLKGVGFGMILFMAALSNISPSIFEAASIDGATFFQKLRLITIPMVKPIVFFLTITGIISSLNAFTEIYAMTNGTGGPAFDLLGHSVKSANIVGFYLFKTFQDGNYGYTAAISFILLLIAGGFSIINYKIMYKSEKE